ncbi:hypothetical protein [uncultured Ferrimonas sp.]|uniref:hypothetical protein n=1 Tax=uncultured Ferrimonas sp. TaxID=432640 RepID=UPI00260ECF21|nr:hypothetical protein [uncultured Ferrimonas sp.]
MRYLIPLLFLIAALSCYSLGIQSGALLLVTLGLLCEFGFWLGLGRLFRQRH